MRVKKRRKSSRYRGSQTARRGRKSRTRGSGNQGGKGMAGTGKRGDQKKTLVINLTGGNNYFRKDIALRRGTLAPKLQVINLSEIDARQSSLTNSSGTIDLSGYKVLGDGELKSKLKIKASAFSASASEKIKSAGGEALLLDSSSSDKKEEPKSEKKTEEKKEKPKKQK